jgi:uncharacterized membrane protein YidH (DUF202 family)
VVRKLLICGLLAGLCGGLVATAFARVVGEPQVARAVAFETRHAQAAGEPAEKPIVSRAEQSGLGLLTAAVVYGLALGGLFALAFAAVYGRIGLAGPGRTSIWLAAGAFVTIFLVPFLKYPANPPSVGDPNTIGKRTAIYLIMILISLLAAVAAARLRGIVAERRPGLPATIAAVGCYLLVVVVAGLLLPSVNEVPKAFPAVTLYRFREAAIGMQAVLWTTIGLVFAGTAERVMTGRTMLPRRRRGTAARTAGD